jgi:hypothetical protein
LFQQPRRTPTNPRAGGFALVFQNAPVLLFFSGLRKLEFLNGFNLDFWKIQALTVRGKRRFQGTAAEKAVFQYVKTFLTPAALLTQTRF